MSNGRTSHKKAGPAKIPAKKKEGGRSQGATGLPQRLAEGGEGALEEIADDLQDVSSESETEAMELDEPNSDDTSDEEDVPEQNTLHGDEVANHGVEVANHGDEVANHGVELANHGDEVANHGDEDEDEVVEVTGKGKVSALLSCGWFWPTLMIPVQKPTRGNAAIEIEDRDKANCDPEGVQKLDGEVDGQAVEETGDMEVIEYISSWCWGVAVDVSS
jgi:hypothetical protein